MENAYNLEAIHGPLVLYVYLHIKAAFQTIKFTMHFPNIDAISEHFSVGQFEAQRNTYAARCVHTSMQVLITSQVNSKDI